MTRTAAEEVLELEAARFVWPEMREVELAAGRRLVDAMIAGDIAAGRQAFTDAVDTRVAMVIYYRLLQKGDRQPDEKPVQETATSRE